MNQGALWLLAIGTPILVATLSLWVVRISPSRHPHPPLSALRRGSSSRSETPAPPLDPPLAPPSAQPTPSPERAAAAEIDRHEAALLIYREVGNQRVEGEVLSRLGLAFAALGATSRALETYGERLELAQAAGDRKSEAATLDNLSLAYAELGESVRAQECHEAAQAIFRDLGDPRAARRAESYVGPSSRPEPADRHRA